jgi:hypothetical protein
MFGEAMMKTSFVIALALLSQMAVASRAFSVCCTYKNPYYHVDLVAGQHVDVGDVDVYIEEIDGHYFLDVVYEIDPDNHWYLAETHLAVVCDDPGAIPQTDTGNPIPGHFPYSMEHDPYHDKEYTYLVPLDQFGDCETLVLYIAAQAEVVKRRGCEIVREETAWGGCMGDCCFSFSGSNWATFFAFGRL